VQVFFDTDALVSNLLGSRERRSRTGKRVKDDPFPQRQNGAHELAEKRLWFQTWVWRQIAL